MPENGNAQTPQNAMSDPDSTPSGRPTAREIEAVLEHAGAEWRRRATDALEAALPTLSKRQEAVVHLTYYQKVADPEIAAVLDLGASTDVPVEHRVHQIRKAALDELTDVPLPDATGEWSSTPARIAALLHQAGDRWREKSSAPPSDDALDAAAAILRAATRSHSEDSVPGQGPPERGGAIENPVGTSSRVSPGAKGSPGAKVEPPHTNDRSPVARSSGNRRWAQMAGVGVAAVVVAYLSLWIIGRATVPATYSHASVEAYDDALTMRVRGSSNDAADRSFRAGADALRQAPTSTLGLFPRYDPDDARRAITSFREAYRATDDPFRRARASFFLAKAHLMTGDVEAARRALNQVLDQNVALYRSDAEALLRNLES